MVAKNSCSFFLSSSILEHFTQTWAMVNIIPKNQRHAVISNEISPNDKGLCQSIWTWLLCIRELDTKLRAISQQILKTRQIRWSGDNQNVLDTSQHKS